MIADEHQAYIGTVRDDDEPPRYILLTLKDLHWLPETVTLDDGSTLHLRAKVADMLASPRGKHGVVAALRVYLYGDMTSGFAYERKRNNIFCEIGCAQRPHSSLFQYEHPTLDALEEIAGAGSDRTRPNHTHTNPGRDPTCSLVGFIDDHVLVGNPKATQPLALLLEGRSTYKQPFRPATRDEVAMLIGIEVRVTASLERVTIDLSQTDYARLWIGRFQAAIHPQKLHRRTTPGYQLGRIHAEPAGTGLLKDVARSFISAAAWPARCTMPELTESVHFLQTRWNHWSGKEDSSLIIVYSYWHTMLLEENLTLSLDVHESDLRDKITFAEEYFSDSDHASQTNRKSTSGATVAARGDLSIALVDWGTKQQPSAARSSGEAEVRAVHDVVTGITGTPTTPDEERLAAIMTARELEDLPDAADKFKAAASSIGRVLSPAQSVQEWITVSQKHGYKRLILSPERNHTLWVDATVAKAVIVSRISRIMCYLRKSMAVDIAFLADIISTHDIKIKKIDTKENLADLFTKPVSESTLRHLMSLINRCRLKAAAAK